MQRPLDRALSFVLTLAAIAMGATLVHREFFAGKASARTVELGTPTYVTDWRSMVSNALVLGNENARMKIMEFGDIECPFCAKLNSSVQMLRKKYPNDVALVFLHFPLPQHRFAKPAARGVECAYGIGKAEQLLNVFYEKQDSLGLKSWTSYARDAGIQDSTRFLRCMADTARMPRVEAGMALGQKIGVRGTPTVLINGWRLPTAPQQAELLSVAEKVLSGKEPFKDGKEVSP